MTADAVGGVWTYAIELVASLHALGIATELVVLGPSPNAQQLWQARANGAQAIHLLPGRLEWMREPWMDVVSAGERLIELADTCRADVVHLNGYCHAAWPFPAPVIVVGHSCVGSWFEHVRRCEPPPEFNRYSEFVRRGLQAATAVTAPTSAMIGYLESRYGRFRAAKPIHNAVALPPAPEVRKRRVVLAAGRLWDEAKNMVALDRAASRISWPIRAAGPWRSTQGERVELESLQLLGALSRRRLFDELENAAIFAHPAKYEPFGLTVLEAAHFGCALVLSNIRPLRELWGECAVFFDVDDKNALADALKLLTEDDSLREAMAHKAQLRARAFQPMVQARAYRDLYRNVVLTAASRKADVQREIQGHEGSHILPLASFGLEPRQRALSQRRCD